MRIVHDESMCASTGMCEAIAPDLFEVREDGWLYVLDHSPGEGRRADVGAAVAACPTGALSIEE